MDDERHAVGDPAAAYQRTHQRFAPKSTVETTRGNTRCSLDATEDADGHSKARDDGRPAAATNVSEHRRDVLPRPERHGNRCVRRGRTALDVWPARRNTERAFAFVYDRHSRQSRSRFIP